MIYMRLIGGLGNQMFQYALGRHLAMKNGTELIVDTTYFEHVSKHNEHFVKREYDLDIFKIKVKILDPKDAGWLPCHRSNLLHEVKHRIKGSFKLYEKLDNYRVLTEQVPFYFDKEILKSGKNTYLIGYWQNEKYFKEIENQIRQDFAFNNMFDENVNNLAAEIAKTQSVCIHVRRGDFVNNPIHGFVGIEYISKAVNYIRERIDMHKIYVFSDEIEWCKQNLQFEVPHVFVDHDYTGEKVSSYLYLMTQCRHFIIPNSTFGWWGAWLSSSPAKIVIAPKQWVNVPGLDASDVIPDGWVTV